MVRRLALSWLWLVAVLFLASQSFGQLTSTGAGKKAGGGGGGRTCTDGTESAAFIARTSGLSAAQQDNYCVLINGLVSDSVWSLIDCIYIFATTNTTTANLNLKSTSFGLTQNGSLTFTAGQGYTGDAATGYLNTGFTPTTASGNFLQNSASIGSYVLNSRTVNQQWMELGASANTGASLTAATYAIPKWSDGNSYLAINSLTSDTVANGNAQGLRISSRTGATTVNKYLNGNTTPVLSSTIASSANINNPFMIMAGSVDFANTPSFFTGDQLSSAYLGGGVTASEMNKIATRVNAYMTALSINVY